MGLKYQIMTGQNTRILEKRKDLGRRAHNPGFSSAKSAPSLSDGFSKKVQTVDRRVFSS